MKTNEEEVLESLVKPEDLLAEIKNLEEILKNFEKTIYKSEEI